MVINDFLYLDSELLRSLLSQFDEGSPESVAEQKQHASSIKGKAKGGIPLVAELGTDAGYVFTRSSTETKSIHHYAFAKLYKHLQSKKLINKNSKDGVFTEITGNIRFVDGAKMASDMKKLPALISGLKAAMKFTDQTQDFTEMDQIEGVAPELGELIESLIGGNLLAKIGEDYLYLDRDFVHSNYAPELKASGLAFEGDYTLIGLPSKVAVATDDGTDTILTLVNALAKIETSMLEVSHIKPLAIYRSLV